MADWNNVEDEIDCQPRLPGFRCNPDDKHMSRLTHHQENPMHVEFDPETEQRIAAIRSCLTDFAIYEKEHNARCNQFWEEYIKPLVDSAPDRSTRQDLLIRICGAGLCDEYGQRLHMPAAIATHKAYAFTAP